MKKRLAAILDEMPLGAVVFDGDMKIIYHNNTADKYFKRYGIVQELTATLEKIFRKRHSAEENTLSEDIPFKVAPKGKPVNLSLRYLYSEDPFRRISVFISLKPCNSPLNVEELIRRYKLTNKESEIFRNLVRGLKNTDIAGELHMKEHTVRDHLRSIYAKCGVKSKLELVRNVMV